MKRVSGKQFARALERHGWRLSRSKGSHFGYIKPGHPPVSVPIHGNKTLKLGTQRGLMKRTGLRDEDL